MFSCEFCEIFKNIFSQRTPPVAASKQKDTADATVKFRELENCIIPQAVGVTGTTHVPILAPDTDNRQNYFSRKQEYSVNTEAVIRNNLEMIHDMIHIHTLCYYYTHCVKSVQKRSFFRSVFSRIRTEYEEIRSIRTYQSECGKIRTIKNSVFGHFPCSGTYRFL